MNTHHHTLSQHRVQRKPAWGGLVVVGIVACVLGLSWAQPMAYAYIKGAKEEISIKKNKVEFKGHVNWTFLGLLENNMKPILDGKLTVKDAGGLCFRLRMDYFGGAHVNLVTKYGGIVCPKGDKKKYWDMEMSPYASNKVNEVKVSIEKKTTSKDWTIIGSERAKLKTIHHKVKITEDGFDFGGKSFARGAPTKAGDVAWVWSGGKMTPRITGTLHIKKAAGACARLQVKYFALNGDLLTTKVGGKYCASDNARWHRPVDLAKYSDWRIASLRVGLQVLRTDDSWRTVGHVNSHLMGTSYD